MDLSTKVGSSTNGLEVLGRKVVVVFGAVVSVGMYATDSVAKVLSSLEPVVSVEDD